MRFKLDRHARNAIVGRSMKSSRNAPCVLSGENIRKYANRGFVTERKEEDRSIGPRSLAMVILLLREMFISYFRIMERITIPKQSHTYILVYVVLQGAPCGHVPNWTAVFRTDAMSKSEILS
jgi:hypothetical protein